MRPNHFSSRLAVAARLGRRAVLLGALSFASLTGLTQSFPKPSPPSPSEVANAVQGAVNKAEEVVTELTADQKQKAEQAKQQIEAKLKAAVEALKIRVNQRVTQLNTYYSNNRKTRQASQKTQLEQRMSCLSALIRFILEDEVCVSQG